MGYDWKGCFLTSCTIKRLATPKKTSMFLALKTARLNGVSDRPCNKT